MQRDAVPPHVHGGNGHLNIRQMERALMFFYGKAFGEADEETRRIRRASYGNLHKILSGCYFRISDYPSFVRHAARSLWLTPHNIKHFAAFPFRLLRRGAGGGPRPAA